MIDNRINIQILTEHKKTLDTVVKMLDALAPASPTVSSLDITVHNLDGTESTMSLDADSLDTYLMFMAMHDIAQSRSNILQAKIEELNRIEGLST